MGTPSLPSSSGDQSRSDELNYWDVRTESSQQPQIDSPETEGAVLYRTFLSEEFRRRNLPEPSQVLNRNSTFHSIPEPSAPYLVRTANQLRMVTEEFQVSPLRSLIDEQAAAVPLEQLDINTFSDLLYGLFQEGGVTSERVVVLFYFCTDLAIRAFRENLSTEMNNIVEWSIGLFRGERILRWVIEHGGWANVLETTAAQVCKIIRVGFFMLGILAFASYIWKARS